MGQTLEQYKGAAVEAVWDSAKELLQESLQHSNGEISLEQLRRYVHLEEVQLFLGIEDGKVELVIATELVQYPQYKVVRILQVAGKFSKYVETHFGYFVSWAVANGAISIESYSRPEVTRFLKRFRSQKIYDVCRISLKGYLS